MLRGARGLGESLGGSSLGGALGRAVRDGLGPEVRVGHTTVPQREGEGDGRAGDGSALEGGSEEPADALADGDSCLRAAVPSRVGSASATPASPLERATAAARARLAITARGVSMVPPFRHCSCPSLTSI